jgi:hypothetical protein
MAIAKVGTQPTANFSATSVDLDFGAAPSAGDVVQIFVVTDTGHTASIQTTAGVDLGFTQEDNQAGGSAGESYFTKVCAGTEPQTMRIDFGGATELGVAYGWRLSGVDGTGSVYGKAYGTGGSSDTDGFSTADDLSAPSTTSSAAADWVCGFFGCDPAGAAAAQARSPWTLDADLNRSGNAHLILVHQAVSGAAAPSVDSNITTTYAPFSFVLKAATVSGSTYTKAGLGIVGP